MESKNTWRGFTQKVENNRTAGIGQVKPDINCKQAGELSSSRLFNSRAFTLIELLVVVLIIGILAAVALPQYNKVVKRAQGKEALMAINTLHKALDAYYLENGEYPAPTKYSGIAITLPELKYFKYMNYTGTYTNTWTGIPTYENRQEAEQSIKSIQGNCTLVATFKPQQPVFLRVYGADCWDYFDCVEPAKIWSGSGWQTPSSCTIK